MEGRKGLSENSSDICDLLLIAGTDVPAGHRTLPVLGSVPVLWISGRCLDWEEGVLSPDLVTSQRQFPPPR